MTDFDIDNTRKTINALRAYYGASPTAMTDEQIEAGREVYGAKKHVDMVIVDEMDVLDSDKDATLANELNPDGLPVGLTISNDGSLLNWRGENYVRQDIDGAVTLTANQVIAIFENHQPEYCSNTHVCFDWQAIADELNAALGSGTCNPEETETLTYYDEYGHDTVKVHVMECDECGGTYEHVYGEYERCPRCGRKAVEYGDNVDDPGENERGSGGFESTGKE